MQQADSASSILENLADHLITDPVKLNEYGIWLPSAAEGALYSIMPVLWTITDGILLSQLNGKINSMIIKSCWIVGSDQAVLHMA